MRVLGGRLLAYLHRAHWVQAVQGAGLPVVFRAVFRPFVLPFVRFVALRSLRCLQIWLYLAF